MSIKTTLASFFDNAGLGELFHRKPTNVAALRAPLLKGIARARQQFESGQARGAKRWWKAQNGVVALTVTLKGDLFDINGVSTNMMPEDRFAEFLARFAEAVEAGEFDSELINHGEGTAQVHIGRTPRAGTGPEAVLTRGQKAAATRARNKTAREAANA